MSTADSKESGEAEWMRDISAMAEKHGCTVRIDPARHMIEFNCPDKQSELDLAMEIKLMMGEEENRCPN